VIALPYRILAVAGLLLAALGAGYVQGVSHEQGKEAQRLAERQEASLKAVFKRLADNKAQLDVFRKRNETITRVKNEELTQVRDALASERLRLGPTFCGGAASAANSTSAGSSNDADSSGRVLPSEIEGDFKALMLEMESAAAAGRACQTFVKENKLAP